ncbi:serine hydrolase [Steroidobacter sp.]|uniref:serine hydrolase n=1 Tax=Steroidobacter sp. TaxID=1978227 RepID=UPI001A457860|nr:serine hydrolase [Steroidobacter sp.]MBL8269266.1 serine hydrolase [Steroidobacter sp.]
MLLCAAANAGNARSSLDELLGAELADFPGRAGLYVKHLGTGEVAGIRADDSFNSQSVIKIAILIRAFQLADRKQLDLDQRIEIQRADLRDGSGVLQFHSPGLAPTIRDLLLQMVITSDNTATDLLIVRIGGVEALNGWLAASGYPKTRKLNRGWEYRRKLLTLIDAQFARLTPEETTGLQYAMQESPLFERYAALFVGERAAWVDKVRSPAARESRLSWNRRMVEERRFWLGDMNPRETGQMIEAIERCTLVSQQSCAAMKWMLRSQLAGSRRLPHFLNVPVAHKTGDSALIANDVGIVYARSGAIVMAFFVNGITGALGDAEDRMGRIAQRVVAHFDGAASRPDAP